jgi:preprotein translocase subunit SecF
MNIKERIKKLGTYFNNLNISSENNIIYVHVKFPKGWGCSEVTEHNFNVKCVQDEIPGYFYFYADIEVGFDKVFDSIEYNIQFNEEAQAKVELLKIKVEELKNIFEEEDIETLKTLEFKVKKKKETKVKKKKETNHIQQEINEVYQTQINNEMYKNNEEEITIIN